MSYDDFSHGQKVALAVLPKISSVFSLFGSGWITIEVLTHKTGELKRHHPYHRLLLAMSIFDILESVWNFTSTWPIPATSNKLWAAGNTQTCSAQGFFLTLSVAVPIYNALLAVYYLLVIKYQWRDQVLKTRVEPLFHVIASGWAFLTALVAAFTDLYNDAGLWCWIAPYPANCLDTIRHGDEGNCERGDNAWVFQWAFYFAPLWASILMATACTFTVYIFVRNLDEKTLMYRKPHRHASLRRKRSKNSVLSSNRKGMPASKAPSRKQGQPGSSSLDNMDLNNRTPMANTIHEDHAYDEPSSLSSFSLSELDYEDDDMDEQEYIAALAAASVDNSALPELLLRKSVSSAQSSAIQSSSNAPSVMTSPPMSLGDAPRSIIPDDATPEDAKRISDISQITMELQADRADDAFLAGRKEDPQQPQRTPSSLSILAAQLAQSTTSLRESLQLWREKRQIYREDYPRTVAVIAQACWYLGTFYVTHVWSTTNRLLLILGVDDQSARSRFALMLIHSWFDPFQGFLNYYVYQRPRYLFIRKTMPEIGRIRASLRVLRFSFQKQNELNQAAAELGARGLGGRARRRQTNLILDHNNAQPPTSSSSLPPLTNTSRRRRSSSSLLGLSRQSSLSFLGDDSGMPMKSSMITSIVEEDEHAVAEDGDGSGYLEREIDEEATTATPKSGSLLVMPPPESSPEREENSGLFITDRDLTERDENSGLMHYPDDDDESVPQPVNTRASSCSTRRLSEEGFGTIDTGEDLSHRPGELEIYESMEDSGRNITIGMDGTLQRWDSTTSAISAATIATTSTQHA